jgi:hypothetical protein
MRERLEFQLCERNRGELRHSSVRYDSWHRAATARGQWREQRA